MANKPPIGIMPKSAHDYMRAQALNNAITRQFDIAQWPPEEWVHELNELCDTYAPARLPMRIEAGSINFMEGSFDAEE